MSGLGLHWRKSSRSIAGGHCLEIRWRRSSWSSFNGNCAEAALRNGAVLVRDSKLGKASPVLAFPPQAWGTFLASIKEPGA